MGASDRELADVEGFEEDASPSENSSSKELRVTVLGIPLHQALPSEKAQLMAVSATVLVASVSFAVLQERVLYVPGFKYTGWLAIVTSLTYVGCACGERLAMREPRRLGSVKEYAQLSIMTMGGMYLTNWSLRYLSYPLRVVFKSTKLVPVMALGVICGGKRYTASQYISVSLLTIGVAIFTLGDAKGKASFDVRGIAVIALGSVLEAMGANYEEQRLFNQLGCPASEVLLYSSLFGCFLAAAADLFNGDFFPALRHSTDHPETVAIIAVAALAGYVATNGVLVLIKHFGATLAEIVKCCRKILTICISFLLYEKQLTRFHVVGCLLFAASFSVERAAAGGTSRRLAGLPMVASVVLLFSASGASTWSVVIDAGSMGSRVNVFRYEGWTSQLRPIQGAAQVWVGAEPGIGAFSGNASGLQLSLRPLLEVAVATVPSALRSATPLAFRATGLRHLPSEVAEALLGEARSLVQSYGFQDAGVQVLEGAEQGECEWLTVNFLLGTFRPGVQAVSSPVAVVDLAADAAQMAYFLRDADAAKAKRKRRGRYVRKLALPFGSGYAHLYQKRYVGHGLMSARVKTFTERSEADHPCLPAGQNISWRHGEREFQGRGTSDHSNCTSLATQILHLHKACDTGQSHWGKCSFAGAWGGPGFKQPLVLKSFFYDRMVDAGVLEVGTQNATMAVFSFTDAARRACDAGAKGLDALAATYPRAPLEIVPWLCFDFSYMAALLSKGFALEDGRPVTVLKKINYDGRLFEASWALGMSIKSTQTIAR